MKEIREILNEIAFLAEGEKAVLATVVDLKGSGYRLPGARMLIKANGDATGTVSGGCLEADVMERAKRVLETGRAEVFVYDTTADENSVFSLNMGCRGVLRILLEAVDGKSIIIRALEIAHDRREKQAVATLISATSAIDVNISGRLYFSNVEKFMPEWLPGFLEESDELRNRLEKFFETEASHSYEVFETKESSFEFAFETIKPPVQLILLGAGADAVPLADTAHGLGWQVKVYDHRPAFVNRERFATSDELVLLERDAKLEIRADDLTAIVSMNHNYERDKAMLSAALGTNAFYVGALGPKKRTAQIMDELGNPFDDAQLARLRSPAGLDIGADTPEAIAISIIAEIQSVLKHRNGGPLRDRAAPIYDRK